MSKKTLPWVRWFPSDWLAGSRGLSPSETAIYITVINLIYEKDGPIEVDAGWLARYCSMPRARARESLDALVEKGKLKRLENGRFINSRAAIEIRTRSKYSTEQRKRAISGRAKKHSGINGAEQPGLFSGAAETQPTRTTTRVLERKGANAPQKKARAARLSEDWKIPNEWIAEAVAEGLTQATAMAEAEAMKNWSLSAPGGAKLDWRAAWRNWYRRRLANPSVQQPRNRGDPPDDDFRRELDRITKGG